MSKPRMDQFMGSEKDRKPRPVEVTYDPSIIKKPRTSVKTDTINTDAAQSIGSSTANMALSASLGKDERKFRLEAEFNKGNVMTISSAVDLLAVSYSTAKKYATELNIALYDDRQKQWLSGQKPAF